MSPTPSIPDFTVIRRIGGGGYGEVWLGRSVTGVLRAIKIIRRDRFADDRPFFRELDGITHFQQAVRDQPRQLALLHVGRDDTAGRFYYVMELADDADTGLDIDPERYVPLTLKELLSRRRRLPAADCLRLAAELATALGDLHRAGLLHRDIKPSNIILVDGHAKIADIGLVAATDQTISSVGTPEYAAPEGTGSARADLYSLGKVIYELATGLPPSRFPELPPDTAVRSDAAELIELNEILLRTCHFDPAQRYPDAGHLLSDVRLAQAGRSVQELNRTRRQLRALTWFAACAGAAALLVIGILGVRNYFALRELAAQETAFRQSAEANERLASYTSDLHFAQLALSAANIGAARTALRRQLPTAAGHDLRGLEWFVLWNESAGDESRLFGSVGGPAVTALALSPAGDTAVFIERGPPNRLVFLDLKKGARKIVADDCYGLIAYDSTAGRVVVTDASLHLSEIDVATHERRPQAARGIPLDQTVAQGTVLLTSAAPDNTTITAWNFNTSSVVFQLQAASLQPGALFATAALTADARRIACAIYWEDEVGEHFDVLIRDLEKHREIARFRDLAWIGALHFSPDGRYLAVTRSAEIALIEFDESPELVSLCAATGNDAVAFSPDSHHIAVGSEHGRLQLWSVSEKTKLADFKGHEAGVWCVDWSGDGRLLASGSMDGTVRLWKLDRPRRPRIRPDLWSDLMGSIAFSSDSSFIVATDRPGGCVLFDTATFSEVRSLPAVFHPLAATPDGKLLALTSDWRLVKTNLRDAAPERTPLSLAGKSAITAFALSSDRRLAAFAHEGGELVVWNLDTFTSHSGPLPTIPGVKSIAISRNGRWLALGDWSGLLRMVDLETSEIANLPGDASHETSLLFSDNDLLLAAGTEDGRLAIWDHQAKSLVARTQAHGAAVRHLVFTPDGSRLLTGGAEGLIIVWSTANWHWLAAWSVDAQHPHGAEGVYLLASSDNGDWLAALTDKGTLQLWDCRVQRPSPPAPF
jgi:FOG: WD40 repeat